MKNVIFTLILTYGFLSLSVLQASDRCIHLGDSQSSASPFSKALQQDLASMNYQVYTYARPSSRTSHWADAKISSIQGPKLTKGEFVFYPTWSEPDRGHAHMNDKKKIEIRREIEKSLKSYDCQLVSTTGYGDNIDYSFKENLKSIGRYTSDGLHLNKTGGKMWADEVFAQIKPTLQGHSALREDLQEMENVSNSLSSPTQKSCP